MVRNFLRRQGHFMTGTVTAGLDYTAWNNEADVNTHGREYDRESVPTHASDNNVIGNNNLFLTNQYGDLPAPAGMHPWMMDG